MENLDLATLSETRGAPFLTVSGLSGSDARVPFAADLCSLCPELWCDLVLPFTTEFQSISPWAILSLLEPPPGTQCSAAQILTGRHPVLSSSCLGPSLSFPAAFSSVLFSGLPLFH